MTLADVAAGAAAEDETVFERQMRTVFLRNAGGTFRQIATQTGVSPAQVRKDHAAGLRQVAAESIDEMILRQRSVLFDVQKANYAAMAAGDIDAARIIIAALEREAKLFGLDAPTRVSIGVNEIEFAERAAAAIEAMGLAPPRELDRARGAADRGKAVLEAEVIDESARPFDIADGGGPFDMGGDDESTRPFGESESEPGSDTFGPTPPPAAWSNI